MGDGVTTKVQCSYSVKDDDITPDAVTYLWEDDLRIYCPTKKYDYYMYYKVQRTT